MMQLIALRLALIRRGSAPSAVVLQLEEFANAPGRDRRTNESDRRG